MTVNVISESKYFPNTFRGLHTAFLSNIEILRRNNITIKINSFGKADITHIHSLGFFSLYKLLTSKRTVVSSHTLPATMVGTFRGSRYWGGLFKKYLTFFYNRADVVVTFSSRIKEELQSIGIKSKIVVIPNPVDTSYFKPNNQLRRRGRKKWGLKKEAVVVIGAGRVVPRKGIKDFIIVAKELPSNTFVWVGGDSASIFQTGIEKKYLEKEIPVNVHFLGRQTYKEMPMLFAMADVLFFPSYQETQGLVIIEAAACGLPLILRDLPEYQSIYKYSYKACKTNEQFKKAIIYLATHPLGYQKARMTSLALAKKFSYKAVEDKLLSCYYSLLQKN